MLSISGFQASNIGQYGIEDFSWSGLGGSIGASFTAGSSATPFFNDYAPPIPLADLIAEVLGRFQQPRTSFPTVRTQPVGRPAYIPVPAVVGAAAVEDEENYQGDNAQASVPGTGDVHLGNDIDTTIYVEDEVAAFDWGELAGNVLGAAGSFFGADAPSQVVRGIVATPSGVPNYGGAAVPPRTVTVDTVTGKVTACRRRRRRKMLTETDFNTLLRISTLPNNQNVRIALAKAIGRR